MAKLSLAMTTYCGEMYVEQQLISLRDQSRPLDEVIILDDRSTDRTAEIVTAFIAEKGLSNWHFEVNSENLGFIRNFRRAISKTTGDVIFLCDQDDIWHADKIETMAAIFEQDPAVMAVNASFQFIDGDGAPLSVEALPGTANHSLVFHTVEAGAVLEIPEAEIVKSNISPGCTMAFSAAVRTYYLEHGTNLMPHDFELNIYAARLGKLLFLNRELISYRIHAHNAIGLNTASSKAITFSGTEDYRMKVLSEQEKQVAFLRQYSANDPAIAAYTQLFSDYVSARVECLRAHKVSRWFWLLRKSRQLRPAISLRQNIGDLIYCLRLQKLFGG